MEKSVSLYENRIWQVIQVTRQFCLCSTRTSPHKIDVIRYDYIREGSGGTLRSVSEKTCVVMCDYTNFRLRGHPSGISPR